MKILLRRNTMGNTNTLLKRSTLKVWSKKGYGNAADGFDKISELDDLSSKSSNLSEYSDSIDLDNVDKIGQGLQDSLLSPQPLT